MPLNMGARRAINFRGRQYGTWAGSTRERHQHRVVRRAVQHCQESLTSEPADQSDDLTRSFVRLINLPTYPLDRLSRYELRKSSAPMSTRAVVATRRQIRTAPSSPAISAACSG